MERIFEQFTITVLKLNKLVQKIKMREMSDYGLKTIHVMCVYYLKSRPNGLTAAELSKLTLEDKAAISRALKTLKEKGYVSYNPNKYNEAIALTDDGLALAEQISQKAAKAVEACSYTFTDEERTRFYSALEAVAENLENYYGSLTEQ
ncbi:MAG: MarR family winged helix-turn-helix transcriptional regulator [Candidatus Coproplasma sp.]